MPFAAHFARFCLVEAVEQVREPLWHLISLASAARRSLLLPVMVPKSCVGFETPARGNGSRIGPCKQAKPFGTVKFELIWNDRQMAADGACPLIFGLQTSISGANPNQSE
ncbi:hypothetical protein [Mesorhizobium sp.]|uniref:hypothetical protein n=2 Tax=Mesorhizobium sp. TaxID=1871066 RepID=UPI00121E4933|nr:hypothetical protein [Mesorhizobium sp.]TIO76353.1 MAG: hypothetical protein E5X75_15435 [Mesorhizobium sp.]